MGERTCRRGCMCLQPAVEAGHVWEQCWISPSFSLFSCLMFPYSNILVYQDMKELLARPVAESGLKSAQANHSFIILYGLALRVSDKERKRDTTYGIQQGKEVGLLERHSQMSHVQDFYFVFLTQHLLVLSQVPIDSIFCGQTRNLHFPPALSQSAKVFGSANAVRERRRKIVPFKSHFPVQDPPFRL